MNAARGGDHVVLNEAIETLKTNYFRAVSDGAYGRVGVEIAMTNGTASHHEVTLAETKKPKKRAAG